MQGIGYDSLASMLDGELAVSVLVALALAKLGLTALTVASGIPIGIIGPVLVSGAAAGGLCGLLGHWLWPAAAADPSLFAMLGMAAMMGAVLQAPLAALMALLELTHNPNIILPGMLAVVISGLTARRLCRCEGFFINLTRHGLHPLQQPLAQALSRVSVPAVMERSLVRSQRMVSREEAEALLHAKPVWVVIVRSRDDKPTAGAQGRGPGARVLLDDDNAWAKEQQIDLLEVPGQRLDMAPIHLEATLSEALDRLNDKRVSMRFTWKPRWGRSSGVFPVSSPVRASSDTIVTRRLA